MNPSTSNDSTDQVEEPNDQSRSERVIEEISTKLEGGDVRSPLGVDWRWWAGLSAAILATAMLASVFIFGYVLREGQQDDAKEQRRINEIEECARRYAVRVTNADTENDIAQDDLILFLADPFELQTPEREAAIRQELIDARTLMAQARDDRVWYEQNQVLPCPISALPNLID